MLSEFPGSSFIEWTLRAVREFEISSGIKANVILMSSRFRLSFLAEAEQQMDLKPDPKQVFETFAGCRVLISREVRFVAAFNTRITFGPQVDPRVYRRGLV